jgi:hypothetical protein
MTRKKSGGRSVKGDKKTSQLLERGETPRPEERLDPAVDSPGESAAEGGPGNDASYSLNRGEGYGTLGGGVYHEEGAPEDSPRHGDWARHSTQGRTPGTQGQRPRRKPDESLAREIHEILTSDPELDATDIEVVVEGGAVTLSGDVEHPDAKLLAEELTESITGVRLVHNRLVVRR